MRAWRTTRPNPYLPDREARCGTGFSSGVAARIHIRQIRIAHHHGEDLTVLSMNSKSASARIHHSETVDTSGDDGPWSRP